MRNPFSRKPKNNGYGNYDDSYDRDFYRGDDEEEVIDDYENEELPPAGGTTPAVPPARKSGGASGANMVKVAKPRDYQDVSAIADHLIDGYTVVMNIEELDRPTTIRMIDYLLGALYVLGGEMRRVTSTTLVLSPRSGEVVGDDEGADDI